MNTINITNARQNLFQLVSDVNKGFNPVHIINNKGENAVLLSERDWKDIEKTIYLNSIPGFVESIHEARKEDKNKCTVYKKRRRMVEYKIIFSKLADKDKKSLKQAGLENETKELLDLIAMNPYQTPPTYEK